MTNVEFFASPASQNLLHWLSEQDLSETQTLNLLTKLRRDHTAEQASTALEMARLRLKAVEKFGDDARRMLFTRSALEQASDPLIRRYRAGYFVGKQVVDAGCGIGADSLAMAQAGADVTGLDIDAVRIAIARYNADALGINVHFEVADIRHNLPDADAVFFDPARRDEQGKRIYDVERYQPPLSIINTWNNPQIAVKLSPGVDLEQLEVYDGVVEFISVKGDLKEAVLWIDTVNDLSLRATLLLDHAAHHWPQPEKLPESSLSEPRTWLVEPDPALLRAGLVTDAAREWDAYQLDETIAYLTADSLPDTPWMRSWRVRDWMPFNLKKLRAYLRERNIGTITVKKRGSAITPEELTAGLKLKGDGSCTLVLTRLRDERVVLICDDAFGTINSLSSSGEF
jgi:SAM-dependent methyltransferase